MAKNKKNSGAAVKNKAMLQEMLLKNAINIDMRKAFDKGTQQGYGIAVLIIFWLLHTEHGFGKKRLAVFMRQINDFCMDYIRPGEDGTEPAKEGEFGGVSLKDIADKLAEETGVFIDVETWQMEVPGLEIRRAGEEGRNINDKN